MVYRKPMRSPRNQRGLAIVWLAIGMTAIMGMGAIAIDISMWYARKGDMQRTADNASLAGAYMLAHGKTITEAVDKAASIASLNGYTLNMPTDHSAPNGTIGSDITYPVAGHPGWFTVRIQATDAAYFSGVLGHGNQHLASIGTAEFQSFVDAPIRIQDAGFNGLATNWSIFGPYGWRCYGDRYSPKYISNDDHTPNYTGGVLTPNPDYLPNGYDFTVSVPSNFKTINSGKNLEVDLFDPDCDNAGGAQNASAIVKNANGDIVSGSIDEIRDGQVGRTDNYTKTDFSLVFTPDNTSIAPKQIADQVYYRDTATDLKWVTPPGFVFDPTTYTSSYGTGRFHVQVKSIDGSSENGFNIRSGPQVDPTDVTTVTVNSQAYVISKLNDAGWHNKYSGDPATASNGINGTGIAAHGIIPLNFNADSKADISLGYVPKNVAGGTFQVQRFDTDLAPAGSPTVTVSYSCDSLGAGNYSGVTFGPLDNASCNNHTVTDTITIPANYNGGNWTAHYWAGTQDSSSWTLIANIPGDGGIHLVGDVGQLH